MFFGLFNHSLGFFYCILFSILVVEVFDEAFNYVVLAIRSFRIREHSECLHEKFD
jgi:hypothetical protein